MNLTGNMVSLGDFVNFLLQLINSDVAVETSVREYGRTVHVDLASEPRCRVIAEIERGEWEATLLELQPVVGRIAKVRFGEGKTSTAEGDLELVDHVFGVHPERPGL